MAGHAASHPGVVMPGGEVSPAELPHALLELGVGGNAARFFAELLGAGPEGGVHVGGAAFAVPDVGIGVNGQGAAEQQGRGQDDAFHGYSPVCSYPRRLDAKCVALVRTFRMTKWTGLAAWVRDAQGQPGDCSTLSPKRLPMDVDAADRSGCIDGANVAFCAVQISTTSSQRERKASTHAGSNSRSLFSSR
jgi:hypothetical protein